MGISILLTGPPRCGKTTLIKQVVAGYTDPSGGFYTKEICEGDRRVGFEVVTLDGQRGVLAHVDIQSRYRVGKYGVDLTALEDLGVGAIRCALDEKRLVVIDEIGPMETFSQTFCQVVSKAIAGDAKVLGTIVKRSTTFTDTLKQMPQVKLIDVRSDNRDELADWILQYVRDA